MKVIDRYLLRELAVPIIYCCLSLVVLVLVADLFDNLDDLLNHKASLLVILKYYLSMIPLSFTQTIPWAAWLGTIFLLVSFGFHNETIAMKAAGLKIISIIRPILFVGFLIGISSFLINDRIVPKTHRIAQDLRQIHINKERAKGSDKTFQNVTYHAGGDQLYFFRTFSPAKEEVNGVVVLWLGSKGRSNRQKMVAQKGFWKDNGWHFENISEYQMDSRGRILGEPQTFKTKTYPEINFTPSELTTVSTDSALLTYKELKGVMQKLKENGINVDSESVDLHYRLAAPWQGLVMMLIAIPLLAKTTNRRTIALNVLVCVALIFTYHVTCAVGMALGKAGKILPFLSAWLGNIIFSVGALLNLDRANH